MLSNSIIDQRRMMQARIDALFAGKISTDAFMRTRKADDEPSVDLDRRDAGATICLTRAEAGKACA